MIASVGEGLFELGLDEGDLDGRVRRGYGGDAANTAVMAGRLGHPARLGGRVGDDALGRLLLAFWQRSGVDTRWVAVDRDAPTGIYVNELEPGGGARFHYHRRASAGSRLELGDLPDDFLDGVDVVHTTGVTLSISESAAGAARDLAERARVRGLRLSFAVNHRPALYPDATLLVDAARAADIVFVSDDEAERLLGTDDTAGIADVFAPVQEVVVTRGARGADVAAGGVVSHADAPPVDAVDAAGAGDALAGTYLASRLEGLAPTHALGRAVLAASLSCRSHGCALSYPDASEVP